MESTKYSKCCKIYRIYIFLGQNLKFHHTGDYIGKILSRKAPAHCLRRPPCAAPAHGFGEIAYHVPWVPTKNSKCCKISQIPTFFGQNLKNHHPGDYRSKILIQQGPCAGLAQAKWPPAQNWRRGILRTQFGQICEIEDRANL